MLKKVKIVSILTALGIVFGVIGCKQTVFVPVTKTVVEKNADPLLVSVVPKDEKISNTTKDIIIEIDTVADIKKVVWYPDNYISFGKDWLYDVLQNGYTVNKVDNNHYSFNIGENGTYTVVVEDTLERIAWKSITIKHFDREPPNRISNLTKNYDKINGTVTINWKPPVVGTETYNSPFDHVLFSYTSNDGISDSPESDVLTLSKDIEQYTVENIDSTKKYYTFYFQAVDELGNSGNLYQMKLIIDPTELTKDFVTVSGSTIDGKISSSTVFIEGRNVTINDFMICDHEVTQSEYESICDYRNDSPTTSYGKGPNYPVYYVSWYDAIVYCNKLSINHDLTPCYSINEKTNPDEWGPIPTSRDSTWESVKCNFEANGYRLPTVIEWEYAARGGNGLTAPQTQYAGSNIVNDVAWNSSNSNNHAHEVKGLVANSLGLYDMSGNVAEMCWDWGETITASTSVTGPDSNENGMRRNSGHSYSESQGFDWSTSCVIYHFTQTLGFRVVRTIN